MKNKNFLSNFLNLIKIFINFDTKFALFFIEEFSLNDTINEFLIFCPNKNLTSISVDLIIYSLFKIKNDNNNNNNFILKFLNNILYNINALIFDYDCQILFELILKIILIENNLILHLINVNFENFIKLFYNKCKNNFNDDENDSILFVDEIKKNLMKCEHQLLTEKKIIPEESKKLSSLSEEHNNKKFLDKIKNWNYSNNSFLYKIYKLIHNYKTNNINTNTNNTNNNTNNTNTNSNNTNNNNNNNNDTNTNNNNNDNINNNNNDNNNSNNNISSNNNNNTN